MEDVVRDDMFRFRKPIEDTTEEEVKAWLDHPITKSLLSTVEETNNAIRESGNNQELYIGIQHGKEKGCILHLFLNLSN